MQAMSLAIGKAGISTFANEMVADLLTNSLRPLVPPNRTISVPNFSDWDHSNNWSHINVNLSNGSLQNFKPTYDSVQQLTSGTPPGSQFTAKLHAANFGAQYSWNETYHNHYLKLVGRGTIWVDQNYNNNYTYNPELGMLAVAVTVAFVFNPGSNSYQIQVQNSSGAATNVSANIPDQSVLQHQDNGCMQTHVDDATASAIAAIDFSTPISAALPSVLKSIAASGNLAPAGSGKVITYEFGLGDTKLQFPPNTSQQYDGIQIGISGDVVFNGQRYSDVYQKLTGQPLPSLPVPAAPLDTDTHSMELYVSNFELDALHWGFYEAGLLATVVTPADLPDPKMLRVKTFYPQIAAFRPYVAYSMTAGIVPQQTPLTNFQSVYYFSPAAMATLKQQLPSADYTTISNSMSGNVYLDTASLLADLATYQVPSGDTSAIEAATQVMTMIVRQTLQFTLTIENGATPPPNLVFTVTRTDAMLGLALGTVGTGTTTAQTLQFGYVNVSDAAAFVSTTVPGFKQDDFADMIWPTVGEPAYDNTMQALGKTGVPLPIVEGFKFVFDQAVLSIQQGYISIRTDVAFDTGAQAKRPWLAAVRELMPA